MSTGKSDEPKTCIFHFHSSCPTARLVSCVHGAVPQSLPCSVSLFCTTNIIGRPDVPSCSQLHVMAEVMGWAEALGCLTAQHLCPVLPSTAPVCVRPWRNLTPCVTCLEISRNRAVSTVINKLVLTSYKEYLTAGGE